MNSLRYVYIKLIREDNEKRNCKNNRFNYFDSVLFHSSCSFCLHYHKGIRMRVYIVFEYEKYEYYDIRKVCDTQAKAEEHCQKESGILIPDENRRYSTDKEAWRGFYWENHEVE